MTVNNSQNKIVAAGNGVQTVFGFSFIAVAASDLTLILTDSSGVETTLLPANYSVALNPVPAGQIWSLGGTVTYPLASTLTVVRELSLTQLVALGNQGNQFPSAVETALDLLEMQIQQVSELFQRAIVAPVVDPSSPLPLPPVAQRANLGMGFDSQGNPVASALPASGVISSAMQPVVNAASLAAGPPSGWAAWPSRASAPGSPMTAPIMSASCRPCCRSPSTRPSTRPTTPTSMPRAAA